MARAAHAAALLAGAAGAGVPLGCTAAPFTTYPFCDATLPTSARVADAVGRMSLQEKISAMTRPFGSPFVDCHGNEPISSLGIDGLPNYSECLHGVAAGCIDVGDGVKSCPTLFPNAQMIGAAFNRSLFFAVGSTIGDEMRAIQNIQNQPSGFSCWSPQLNSARVSTWGRAQEPPGEDPYLTAEFGVAYVTGLQEGDDVRYVKTAASPKHFFGYDTEGLGPNNETGLCTADKGTWPGATGYPDGGPSASPQHVCRYNYNASVTDRDLVEYYLPQWHAVITRAHAHGMMCAYSAVNGVPSCANHWALTELTREQWGFEGYVVSDCLALQVMMQAHEYVPYDIPLAAATALNAGTDWNCGCVLQNGTAAAIARGLTNETVVDAAVSRILTVLMRLGEFDADVPYRAWGKERLDSADHRALAQDAAAQGLVLRKNSGGALPLARGARVAFIGPNADDGGVMQSSYGGDCHLCANHTPFKAAVAAGWAVTLTRGCDQVSTDTSGFAAAVAAATAADVAVLFLGSYFQWESEWGNGPDCQNDRPFLRLPGVQEDLIAAVVATGKPVVVVLMNGGALAIEKWVGSVDAVVEAFYPGEFGGDAIVDALAGVTNQFGALPFSMYADALSARDVYRNDSAQLLFDGGYTHMYYDDSYGPPVFEFGFGLSYTTFSYAWSLPPPTVVDANAVAAAASLAPLLSYHVNVTNTGARAGDAIVLAFVAGPSPDYPLERLWQFARVALAPGASAVVNFVATPHALSGVAEDGARWLRDADLRVRVGARDGRAESTLDAPLQVRGAVQLPVFATLGKAADVGPLRASGARARAEI
jgi:beta-glucosidase-like glycosyl hydrolase